MEVVGKIREEERRERRVSREVRSEVMETRRDDKGV